MIKPFKPRQKKIIKPVIKTKLVRIDFRTQIEVSVKIPDDMARENYLSRLNIPIKGRFERLKQNTPQMPIKEEFRNTEIPMGDITELEELVVERAEGETEEE